MTRPPSNLLQGTNILAVGGLTIDIVLRVDRLPGHDEKVLSSLIGRLPGGPPPNFACAASNLGVSVKSLAHVGSDEAGEIVVADLARHNVDTEYVEIVPGETLTTIILLDSTGEKAIIVVPSAKSNYRPELIKQALRDMNYIYMWPEPRDAFVVLSRQAHENNVQVMIDVEDTACEGPDFLEAVLPLTEIASFNYGGFRAATGFDSVSSEKLRQLLQYGPHTVVVTNGSKGAHAVTESEEAWHHGYDVPVIDSTGAGDTFNAAFLVGTILEYSLSERLAFACAAGAISVTGLGPRGHLPSFEETRQFIATNDQRKLNLKESDNVTE